MNNKEFIDGWDYMASLIGNESSGAMAAENAEVINRVEAAIEELKNNMNQHPYKGLGIDQFKGYGFEEWHSGTFNIDAAAKQSSSHAEVLHSTEFGSVDIGTNFGRDYSAKLMATPEKSFAAQAVYFPDTATEKYANQERLVAKDHLEGAVAKAHREALRNIEIRPQRSAAYAETEKHLTDIVADGEGVESTPINTKEIIKASKEAKNGEFDPANYGQGLTDRFPAEYYVQKAVSAGLTAATITALLKIMPEIMKAVDYLIKNGEIDIDQVKRIGAKGISGTAEGFLRGTITYSVVMACSRGALGEALKNADPTHISAIVVFVIETAKNAILVASGKMNAREMGSAFLDSAILTAGFAVSMKAGSAIGGIIGQVIGFEFPALGYIIGSLIGCAISAAYNLGKKRFMSICVDTGFTCFGLVEQDYTLPDEVLESMGIDLIQIGQIEIDEIDIDEIEISTINIEEIEYETFDIVMVKRGVIGINKIGYI